MWHYYACQFFFFRAKPVEAFLDDYAFLIRGLLDLYEACFNEDLIEWAYQLQTKQNELFYDSAGGGYFSTKAGDPAIVMRMKDGKLHLQKVGILHVCTLFQQM